MRPPLVLAYHSLGSCPRELDPYHLVVAPAQFRAQISLLRRRGYRFVSLSEFVATIDGGKPTAGTCAVTFDDGTLDNLEVVAPLLAELVVPATFFVCPGLLGEPHFAMPPQAGIRLMNAEELRTLASAPLASIGSHTLMHTYLESASAEEAYREMIDSKLALEELLQRPVDSFAYPRCAYSPVCPDAARRAGYAVAVSCGARGSWSPFELARESVDSLDGRLTFALKSRRLFMPLRNSLPGRAARAGARRLRFGRG
jgi:peptidoglycan/xylan/chitin deacetylase (PgdA/CDA1 family)